MLNLAALLEDSSRKYPSRTALVLGEDSYTYGEVNRRANEVANLLVARGIQPGDKVALSCPNLPLFPIVYFGILKAGAVVVPLNILLKGREVAYHLNDSGAKAYFCFEGGPELPIGEYGHAGFEEAQGCKSMFLLTADPAAPSPIAGVETAGEAIGAIADAGEFETVVREATDTAIVLYTSGTTGQPKGAELTHANMTLNAFAAIRLFDSSPMRLDTCLITLPLFHSFGQTVSMNAALGVGSTLVLVPRFDAAEVLGLMEKHSITVFAGVPTMFWALLGALEASDVDVEVLARNMRRAISGGAALPVEILTKFKEKFGVQILEGYGLSETSPLAMFSDPERAPRPGSIGVPVWGIEARLVDREWNTVTDEVGEIALRGHNVMKGYLNRPDATEEVMHNGWFRTGDLARVDEDGYYFIVDRAKDLIVRGGFNVYPREIEEVLLTHEAVSLVAVVGVPSEQHGEEIKAFVIPAPSAQVTEAELIAWSKEQMASYKYPRRVEFVEALPMTATGKILKRQLS